MADALNETRAKVGQALAADQKRWGKDSLLTAFRHELFEQMQRLGGVVTTGELVDLTILLRPAAETIDTNKQQRLASAIARAAVETEGSLSEPRFEIRRLAGKTVVACTDELAQYAEKLGEVADRIAKADPLLPRLRVFQELYDVTQPPPVPGCQPFSNERLIKLAAAMSSEAAVSSRQELYPREWKHCEPSSWASGRSVAWGWERRTKDSRSGRFTIESAVVTRKQWHCRAIRKNWS